MLGLSSMLIDGHMVERTRVERLEQCGLTVGYLWAVRVVVDVIVL